MTQKLSDSEAKKILARAGLKAIEEYPGMGALWKVKCNKCKRNSEVRLATIRNGGKCKLCSGRQVDPLEALKLLRKFDYEPLEKFKGSTFKWKVKHKPCKKEVSLKLTDLYKGTSRCPNCAGNKKISEESARALFIKNNLEPIEPFQNSQKPWKSKCLITGKIVSPTYGKVRDFGHRCKYCSGFEIEPEEAAKLMIKNGFQPLRKYPGGNRKWKCLCLNCNREVFPMYSAVKLGRGCPYCNGHKIEPADAKQRMIERGLKPLTKYPGTQKKWKVKCLNCGRIFFSEFRSFSTNNGCKYCNNVAVDEKDLMKKMKSINLKPLEPYKNAKNPWKSKCLVCGHIVQPTWTRIKQGRGGCAYCTQRRVDIPEAMKFMKSKNLKPLVDFPGNNKPWKCECLNCHKETNPRWSDLRQGQGGCSNCANYGINYEHPGYLYFIHHEKLKSLKIGIGNKNKSSKTADRIYKHKKQGWAVLNLLEFEFTKDAARLETKVLKWVRSEVGLEIHLNSRQMPQGGWSETFNYEEIDADLVWEKIVELSKMAK